jgi:CSLREA domain-containing protein
MRLSLISRGGLLGILALLLLSLPAVASAATITVDSTGDTAANDGTCTLREAIVSSNTDAASGAAPGECPAGSGIDAIEFDDVIFNGQAGDKVTITSTLPAVSTSMDIQGPAGCTTGVGAAKPCVEIGFGSATASDVLQVDASTVALDRLAITNGSRGISGSSAADLTIRGSWIGLGLDGAAAGNTYGIHLDASADGVRIGGTLPAARNVISGNATEGIRIAGGDNNLIQGNYIGSDPAGTAAIANGENIEIVSQAGPGGIATGNEVGGTIGPAETATPSCDGACNVISAAPIEIDLQGNPGPDLPAGATTIAGNFVGLAAGGNAAIPGVGTGIFIGDADGVTIGGPAAADANHISGGTTAITSTGGAVDPVVRNNLIGLNSAGTAQLAAPTTYGIGAGSSALGPAQVSGNRVVADGGQAIRLTGTATVSGNVIGRGTGGQEFLGGSDGIQVASGVTGVVITGNTVANTANSGIRIDDADMSVIGGDSAAEENSIVNGGGAAIAITGTASGNQIKRNTGAGNAGLFIDLGDDGVGNPGPMQGGIAAPVITAAGPLLARGTATAGATVRVFSKATSADGELEAYLGSAVADGSGQWRADYGAGPIPLPDAKRVVATQTDALDNTSELSDPFALTDAVAPAAPAIQTGPGGPTSDATPTFTFSGEPATALECRTDSGLPIACDAGTFTAAALADGPHTFFVTATDPAGNTSPVAQRPFAVDTQAPDTTIDSGPSGPTNSAGPSFGFDSSEANSSFECRLDSAQPADWQACTSPRAYAGLADGAHTFEVRATDPVDNTDQSPATSNFTVDTVAPKTTITKKPKAKIKTAKKKVEVEVSFNSEAGATFRCKLDHDAYKPCTSPFSVKAKTKGGKGKKHTISVQATDQAGNVGKAAVVEFKAIRKG